MKLKRGYKSLKKKKVELPINIEEIAVLGDPHLTYNLPYTVIGDKERSSSVLWYVNSFLHTLSERTLVIIPGDLCHRSFLYPVDLDLLVAFIEILRVRNLPVLISDGNHDLDGDESIISFLGNLRNTYPNIYYFNDETAWNMETNNINFRIINYCSDKKFLALSKVATRSKKFTVLIGHVGIKHTLHGTTKSINGVNPEDIKKLEDIYDLMIFGHHHYFQKVGNKALYPGPIQQIRIDERDQIPGGITIQIPSKKVKKVKNKVSPRFSLIKDYSIDPKEIEGNIVKPILDLENKTEAENIAFVREVEKHNPYYLIRPKTKRVFGVKDIKVFRGGKKMALLDIIKGSRVKNRKEYARHTFKIYEEARKEM